MPSASQRRIAQSIRYPGLPPGLPRPSGLVLHLGSLAGVDLGRNVLSHKWNEPGNPITDGVPFLQSYSPARLPEVGDLTWGLQFGGDKFMVLGRQVVPDYSVILT